MFIYKIILLPKIILKKINYRQKAKDSRVAQEKIKLAKIYGGYVDFPAHNWIPVIKNSDSLTGELKRRIMFNKGIFILQPENASANYQLIKKSIEIIIKEDETKNLIIIFEKFDQINKIFSVAFAGYQNQTILKSPKLKLLCTSPNEVFDRYKHRVISELKIPRSKKQNERFLSEWKKQIFIVGKDHIRIENKYLKESKDLPKKPF